jgi:hypothetical protein
MDPEQKVAVSEALRHLRAAVGEYVWGVQKGGDDTLMLQFGSPHLFVREPMRLGPDAGQTTIDVLGRRMVAPTGQWHLFIDDGEWSVFTKFHSTRRFDTDHARVDAALRQFDGQKLTNVDYLQEVHSWRFKFDLGGTLIIARSSPAERDWSEQSTWVLFYEDRSWVAFGNDLRLSCKE